MGGGVYTVALALALGEAGRLKDAIATAEVGYRVALEQGRADGQAWLSADLASEWGQLASETAALHDLIRIGSAQDATKRLIGLAELVDGAFMAARVVHARAVAGDDLDLSNEASERFEAIGALLLAAEAAALERRLAVSAGLQRRATAAAGRVQRLLDGCEGADTPALSSSSELQRLSTREREVAMLAAQGLSSRVIAERLVVSIRTVDNHLQRIYAKLGITNRADLGGALGIRPD